MHIEIHIFPNSFSIDPETFQRQMNGILERVRGHIIEACITQTGYAKGKQTFPDLEDKGYIEATVDIRGGD